jgi:hypothetical protein
MKNNKSHIKSMIKVNKHQTPISSFEVGTIINFVEIIQSNSGGDNSYYNDKIISIITKNEEMIDLTIWVRHLFDECRTIDNKKIILEFRTNENQIIFPEKIKIINPRNELGFTIIELIYQ